MESIAESTTTALKRANETLAALRAEADRLSNVTSVTLEAALTDTKRLIEERGAIVRGGWTSVESVAARLDSLEQVGGHKSLPTVECPPLDSARTNFASLNKKFFIKFKKFQLYFNDSVQS